MNKKIIIMLVVAAIIVTSGCTGGSNINTATKGMVINSFTFSPNNMVNGEDGTLALEVQNIGGTTAKETKAFLYHVDSSAYFEITEGGLPTTEYSFGDMSPPDTVNNIPSFPETVVWTVDNDGKEGAPEGIPMLFEPKVRLCYLYDTTSTAEFTVISRDELRQQVQRGSYQETPVVTRSSGGPLSIEILTPQPIKADNNKVIKIQVKVRNLDKLNGLVFQNPASIDTCIDPAALKSLINRVDVSISIPELPLANFADQTIRLLKGDGVEGTATFTSDSVDLSGIVQKKLHIVMTTSYGYFVESQASFTLEHEGI
ncbi:MAG: hypothetical protein KAR87_05520 [Candidatus Aenigmarchaeota archaeon]|nr:hypothetical protein [Candidatus Aenigmarchaeota archaeon]